MMTLHELDSLVRRIEEAMERPSAAANFSKFATDYSAVSRAAATRLNQCNSMLNAGDEHQALQLAETHPPLLDILTLLSFRRSPQWRALCRGENLPTAENFDIKSIRRINELYAKGIDKDHALYRDYRRAVMLNEDARALSILRSIVRLNPNDANAKTELDRLDHKIRADKIHHLEKLLKVNPPDTIAIATLAEELERSGAIPNSPAWPRAQSIRAEQLLTLATEAQKKFEVAPLGGAAFESIEASLEKLRPLSSYLQPGSQAAFCEIDTWATAEKSRRREIEIRRAATNQVAAVASHYESEQLSNRKRPLDELRQALAAIDRAWESAQQKRAEISPALAATIQKLRGQLSAEIERSLRASSRLAFTGVAAIVLLCLAATFVAYSRQALNSQAHRLETALAERRIAETESLLAATTNHASHRQLEEARTRAVRVVQEEQTRKLDFEKIISRLRDNLPRLAENPPLFLSFLDSARKAIDALASENRPGARAALEKFENDWRDFLTRENATRTAKFLSILGPLESAAEHDLDYSLDPKQVIVSARKLREQSLPARSLAEAEPADLRPRQEALFRLENLQARLDKFSRDATNFLVAQTQLEAAADLTNYNNTLQLLASSGFTPAAQRALAGAVVGLNLSSQNLLAPLLLPNSPASLLEPLHISRYPDEVLSAEREIQRRLRDDENIHGINRLPIEVKTVPINDPRRHRIVFLRGELQRRITRRVGQVYDPVESPSALQFASKEFGSLEYNVDEPTPLPERELYERAGLSRLLDSNTGKYQVSLLSALDDINQDRHASPVFRAWLFARICEMIDTQPAQWGAIWSPSYAQDRADLNRLGAGQIHSGDWFIPSVNSQRGTALTTHFDQAGLHSYARESAFFKRLLPKAMESGVKVLGHISASGEPIFRGGFGGVFGLALNQRPSLLFENISPNQTPQPRAQPLPYSPLVAFAGNATELIDATLHDLGYSANAVGLPEALPSILRAP